jgi:long-chain acyl-CoA synthetase
MFSSLTSKLYRNPESTWDRSQLDQNIAYWKTLFCENPSLINREASVGVLADNGPDWIALDLAAADLKLSFVPVPAFFTHEQLMHLVEEAQICLLITDQTERAEALGFESVIASQNSNLWITKRSLVAPPALPENVHKITFTSGTTGLPKGVCLSTDQQMNVAQSLALATQSLHIQTHLCLLPFSVLLENIAGVYAPMLANASIVCPPLREVGLTGASQFDAHQCLNAIARFQAESIILLPQMLHAILHALQPDDTRPQSLKFIAVGGGKVPEALLIKAHQMQLPVFEGYGLSECASVVCLNTPKQQRTGTVGKAIHGVELHVDEHQEIWVKGRGFEGYLHELKTGKTRPLNAESWLPTGDLGNLSSDGFLSIHGRKKNLIITSFGRNISPEWPESVLLSSGAFAQVVVFGEAQAQLGAVLVPFPGCTEDQIHTAIAWANQHLPDYAQIKEIIVSKTPFTPHNGLSTSNGRIKREAVLAQHAPRTSPSTQE